MPYTIKTKTAAEAQEFIARLREVITEDDYFAVPDICFTVLSPVKSFALVELRKIRKTTPSEYCGQHPGPCVINPFVGERKKQKNRLLEWEDWVKFHGVVNGVLDAMGAVADVWSRPMEAVPMPGTGSRSKFWIRKGARARVRYDWEEEYRSGRHLPVRLWNMGSPDQFEVDP